MIDILQLDGVQPIDYRNEDGCIVITVQPSSDHLETCPKCSGRLYKHGQRINQFADTPLQMQPVKIEVVRTRYRCSECKSMITPQLSFLDEKRRATHRLIQQVRKHGLNKTFTQLAEETGVVVNTIKNITLDFVKELERDIKFETPTIMGVDELKLMGTSRCVIINLAMNSLYDMLPERTQDSLIPYFAKLPDVDKVEWICSDMSRSSKKLFRLHLPNAKLVIDKFHVVRMASEALDTERKALQSSLDRDARLNMKKHLQWILLRRPNSLTEDQQRILESLEKWHPEFKEAYDLKEQFYNIYEAKTKEDAIQRFHDWENGIPKHLKSFREVAKTVNNNSEDIFTYWDAPIRITNAYTEGHNGITRVANQMVRGYTFEVLRAKMLYNKVARSITTLTIPSSSSKPIKDYESLGLFPTKQEKTKLEYGAYIPTLLELYGGEEDLD
ncbi:transposase [Acinetobacter venetianus]|uniref:ISL3 family transposase n=1 Tax=Acinetobacter venetianus TaxID=52133 RepID=UPI000775D869|nr:ISL3 family transposase [Acinetobacter venetianus]KXO81259.1 transposase [Acinetobacter venetianus]